MDKAGVKGTPQIWITKHSSRTKEPTILCRYFPPVTGGSTVMVAPPRCEECASFTAGVALGASDLIPMASLSGQDILK